MKKKKKRKEKESLLSALRTDITTPYNFPALEKKTTQNTARG
jgi:hypothetical protein